MINKLIGKNIQYLQLISFTLTNIIGLTVLLVCFQLFFDVHDFFQKQEVDIKFITVSKRVSTLGIFVKKSFQEKEINELKALEDVSSVGIYLPATFRVKAYGEKGGMLPNFSTDLFFEAVPDHFIDVKSRSWFWKEGDPIPVILPKSYLALYNFGFATSQGLPQISEGIATSLPIGIKIIGENSTLNTKTFIVGFSDRINTILVPMQFMEWANKNYGKSASPEISRLVFMTNKPSSNKIKSFIEDHYYDVNKEVLSTSKTQEMLYFLVGFVVMLSLCIIGLSMLLMISGLTLMIEKMKDKIHSLFCLGYSIQEISKPFKKICITTSLISFLICLTCSIACKLIYINVLSEFVSNDIFTNILQIMAMNIFISATIYVIYIQKIKNLIQKAVVK